MNVSWFNTVAEHDSTHLVFDVKIIVWIKYGRWFNMASKDDGGSKWSEKSVVGSITND